MSCAAPGAGLGRVGQFRPAERQPRSELDGHDRRGTGDLLSVVVGTTSGNSGDMWTANTFTSDQYSQITVTSTPLTGSQWIGPVVRAQNGGQNLYVGFYSWNSGSPELMLFKRISGSWTQLGGLALSGPLPAGTQLELTAVGSTLALLENGVVEITASDQTLTGGAPGILANSAATAGSWIGGDAGFQVHYQSTDSTGIASYDVISDNNGYGAQAMRVLRPTHPAAGVAHNFLYVLPVEAGLGNSFGDGLADLQALDAEDIMYRPDDHRAHLRILTSWYANTLHPDPSQYETFLTQELVPWVNANLATTGSEQTG